MKIAYKSSQIVLENTTKEGYLVVEDGRIIEIIDHVENCDVVDCGDDRILPGIFDTHNHGALGYSLMSGGDPLQDKKTVLSYLKGIASQGVTSILPTSDIGLFSVIADLSETSEGQQIQGIHSEGPWLNRVGEKGIKTGYAEVSLDTAKKMVRLAKGKLKLVALAPEIPGISEIKDYFLSQGIHVAFAHSDCNYEESMKAFDSGISVSTHTGNVMTGLHHRDIGGLGAALAHPNVECEVICDGKHISLEMIKLYFKVKPIERFMMISDCTPLSGAPIGRYLMFKDMYATITPEGFCLTDTGRLMGSTMPVLYGIRNLVEVLKMPISTVMQMASLNPARKYGIGDKKGSLAVGKDADFFILSADYKIKETYLKGNKIYDAKKDVSLFNPDFFKNASAH
ncbi:MAG: amidohydrolase family protein [Erysipelotrichaceae bacterium]|jgi:N-acetylglucosamine-6-phosphate deacetylase|nr:amidohydrolase family protein [Erysipelotrichaceae bacterium]